MAAKCWQLQLDEATRNYLAARGNALVLRASPRHGCCGGIVLLPVAEPGEPTSNGPWKRLHHAGVTIYVEDGLEIPAGTVLRIGVDVFLGWRRLFVEGLPASM